MEIIEINYDYDMFFNESDLLDIGVKYFESYRGTTIYEIIEFVTEFYDYTGLKGPTTVDEVLEKALGDLPEDIKKDIILEIEEWTEENFKDIKELQQAGYTGEILDYLDSQMEIRQLEAWIDNELLPKSGFHSGTVGYSQWAYFIAHERLDTNYIRSIWDGTDFYVISRLDDRGDVLDSMGWIYAERADDLLDYAKEMACGRPFVLVDNDISSFMDVPKVEKQKHVEYSFEVIED